MPTISGNSLLRNKLSSLSVGTALNVSNIRPDGHGTTIIKANQETNDLLGVDGLPIVSDNIDGYRRALNILIDEYVLLFNDGLNQLMSEEDKLRGKLEKRIDNLDSDYVLDVTNLQPNGTGAKVVQKPKTSKSTLKVIDELDIGSRSEQGLSNALRILGYTGSDYDEFIKIYRSL